MGVKSWFAMFGKGGVGGWVDVLCVELRFDVTLETKGRAIVV